MAADTPMEDVTDLATEKKHTCGDVSERVAGDADEIIDRLPADADNAAANGQSEHLEDEELNEPHLDDVSERVDDANAAVSERDNDVNDDVGEREDGAPLDFQERTSEDERDLEEKEKDWDAESEQLEDEPGEDDDMADNVADDVAGDEELGEGVAHDQELEGRDNKEGENDEVAGVVGEENDGEGAKAGDESAEGPRMISFPLARVKRIVKLDPDIKQVSSEALKTIGLATELFLEALAVSTAHVTHTGKRSTLKLEDLLQTVKTRRRYKDCLGGDLEYLRTVDENQAAKQSSRQSKKQEAARQLPPGVKPITSFFKQ